MSKIITMVNHAATSPEPAHFGTTQVATTRPQSHLAAVDGLRALACLSVVSFHCFFYGGRGSWPHLVFGRKELIPTQFLTYGYLGVELFFVLSGFCLAYPIFRHPERLPDWKRYFLNRARRIYPAYWGALLLLGTLAVLIRHINVANLTEAHVLVLPSIRRLCLSFINPETDLNGSFWTLKIELRWYILLPLLLLLHRRTKSVGLMGVAILVSLIYALTLGAHPESGLSNLVSPLPLFLPLFVAGIWVAEILVFGKPTRLELELIRHARWGVLFSCASIWLFTPAIPEPVFHYSRVVPGGLLATFLLLLTLYDPLFKKLLSWRPLVSIGLFSYSLYLIHQPLIQLVYAVVKPLGWSDTIQFFFFQGVVAGGCILLGYLFYRLAEKPFLRRS